MKTSLLRLLAFAPVAALCLPLHAADYNFVKGNGSKFLWDQNGLWVDSSGTPYADGIHPGAGSSVMGNYNGDGIGVPSLYLNGDRTIRTLIGDKISATNQTSTRIYSGHSTAVNSGAANTLTLTESLDIRAGIYNFWSGIGTSGTPVVSALKINTPVFRLGTAEYTNTTDNIMVARAQFGSSSANSSYVSFTSQETYFSGVASRIEVGAGTTAANTSISLGHVTFDINPASVSTSGIETSTGTPTITVASLHRTTEGGVVRIIGNGTLVIDPDSSTSVVTGVRDYSGRIGDGMRVEKKGDSLQVLSAANDYTGGTAINGGVLAVQNTTGSGLGTGAVTIADGGILAGGGRVALGTGNTIVVESGGAIAPGEANRLDDDAPLAYENLTIVNTGLQFENGAALHLRVGLDGSADRIDLTSYTSGQLLFGIEGLAVDITGDLAEGQTYTLFTFTNSSGSEVASGLTEGLFANTGFDGFSATFHYDDALYGGTGVISMTVVAIPEPGTALLLLPILGGWVCCRFRSKRPRVL